MELKELISIFEKVEMPNWDNEPVQDLRGAMFDLSLKI